MLLNGQSSYSYATLLQSVHIAACFINALVKMRFASNEEAIGFVKENMKGLE